MSHMVILSKVISLGLDLMLDTGLCLYVLLTLGILSHVKLCYLKPCQYLRDYLKLIWAQSCSNMISKMTASTTLFEVKWCF